MQELLFEENMDTRFTPLTRVQNAIWISQNLFPESTLFNIGGYAVISGTVDVKLLEKSIYSLIKKHSALNVRMSSGKHLDTFENISKEEFKLEFIDFSKSEFPQLECEKWIGSNFNISASIENNFFTSVLLKESSDRFYWYVKVHHLIADGFSLSLIFNQVSEIYTLLSQSKEIDTTTYFDHRNHLNEELIYLDSLKYEDDKKFWMTKFRNNPDIIQFEKRDLEQNSLLSKRSEIVINREMYNSVIAKAKEYGIGEFHYFLSLFYVLIHKLFKQENFVIGIPLLNRNNRLSKNTIGTFLNILPITLTGKSKDNFLEIVKRIKEEISSCYRHSKFPLIDLMEQLDTGKNLYNTLFSFEKNDYTPNFDGHSVSINHMPRNEQLEDLSVHVLDYNDSWDVKIIFDYKVNTFTDEQITQLGEAYRSLLENVKENISAPIFQFELVESTILHQKCTPPSIDFAKNQTFLDLFEERVAISPNEIAVVFESEKLSYSELNTVSNQVADYLISEQGIKSGDLIGVMLSRSEQLIITLLGILKAGAAYLPIDPHLPVNRIEYFVDDSFLKLIISEKDFETKYTKLNSATICLEDLLVQRSACSASNVGKNISFDDLIYVIYTSGSTGKPKGVEITHGNVVNLLLDIKIKPGITANDVFLATTTFSFDISVLELFLPLIVGAKIVIVSEETIKNPELLKEAMICFEVTIMQGTPSSWQMLLDNGWNGNKNLKVLCGGEFLNRQLAERLLENTSELWNMYGPTETTVWSTKSQIKNKIDIESIGLPISNTQIYILDSYHMLVPDGFIGEICIAGSGVAKGYRNNTVLTAERFITNPYKKDEKLYKTGDYGKWESGRLIFTGRKDEQVKIRGHRIELGEIENVLLNIPFISRAIVLPLLNERNDYYLVAYIKIIQSGINLTNIRSQLKTFLPDYMLPEFFIEIDEIPLTDNGKIDKKSLPLPNDSNVIRGIEYIEARNEIEEKLISIWEELLDRKKVGIKDDFFELGGHSLKIIRLKNIIYQTFNVRLEIKTLFDSTILENQADLIEQSENKDYLIIPPTDLQSSYPVSSSQRRLWVLSQFKEANVAYNIPGIYEFSGNLDVSVFSSSFDFLIARHESLRTVFKTDESGEVRQSICAAAESAFEIKQIDLRQTLETDYIQSVVQNEIDTPFDLSTGTLLRASLLRVSDDKYIFCYVMHHIISDGWSMGVLIRELLNCYNTTLQGVSFSLPALRIHYKDYSAWQQDHLQSAEFELSKSYWLDQLNGELPVLELPTDSVRPLIKTYNGSTTRITLNSTLSSGLKTLGSSQGATLFMSLLAGINTLLYKYTDQTDIIIGSPIAGRDHADLEDQIGFYVNTLVLRSQFSEADTFLDVLQQIKKVSLDAFDHASYPFDELVDDLSLKRDLSRNALFDVMLVLQNTDVTNVVHQELGDVNISLYQEVKNEISKFDMTFNFIEVKDDLHLLLEYNSDLFKAETIERFVNHFCQLLESIIDNPIQKLYEIDYLTATEKQELLVDFNDTETGFPADKTIIDLFEEQVTKTPEAVAVVFQGTEISFKELDEISNQLAHYLQNNYAITSNEYITINLERSEWLIISILAILKVGCAYVPIAPEYPEERINFIIDDCKSKVIIDDNELIKFKASKKATELNTIKRTVNSSDLVYVIYTSGSTGNPKGCMLEHKGIINRIDWMWNHYGFTAEDVILQKTTFTFDVSVWEIFMPLCWGTKMVLCEKDDITSPDRILQLIKNHKITCLHFVPSMLDIFILDLFEKSTIQDNIKSLRKVFTSGESLSVGTIKKWYEKWDIPIHNLYGPTEASIEVSHYTTTKEDVKIPIGKPIQNTQLYILNDQLQLLPIGCIGQICIGGIGLSRGYLNNPVLTSEKFIDNIYKKGKLYKTGDYGKWLPDGNIEYIGRKDEQIKIRGYRIELGEIENALRQHKKIESCVVIAKSVSTEEKDIVTFFVSKEKLEVSEIRQYLKAFLPDYMIPYYFVQLESFPLTSSGKINRKLLPNPEGLSLSSKRLYVAPRSETEEKLVKIWEEILGQSPIGIEDDFFELGGHSLKATKVIMIIKEKYIVNIDLKILFLNPTIEKLSNIIDTYIWMNSQNSEIENINEIIL